MSLIGGAESKVSLKGKIPVNQMKPKEIPYAGIDEATESGWYVADAEQFGEDMIQFDTMGVSRLLFRTDADELGDIVQTAYLDGYVLRRYKSVFTDLWSPWEWENPPMFPDAEYRTTDRYGGKAVYKKIATYFNAEDIGNAESIVTLQIPHRISGIDRVISCEVMAYGENTSIFPYVSSKGYVSTAASVNSANIQLRLVNSVFTSREWQFMMTYTKK